MFEDLLPNQDIYATNEEYLTYFYSQYIRNFYQINGYLPYWPYSNPNGVLIPLAPNEIIHLITVSVLKEPVSKKVNYGGVSQGFSIKVAKGVNYRVSTHAGKSESVTSFEEVAKGYLFLTNKRLQLIPVTGDKHANIPLNKISSYLIPGNNVIEIHKSGREKPFRFIFPSSTTTDLTGFCLSNLMINLQNI